MVKKKEQLIQWKSEHKSWYPAPMITKEQYRYLKTIEAVYIVQSPDGEYIPIRLTNHQAEYHASDIAICGDNSKSRIVVKSRNTSFTTNSIISMLNACYNFRNQIKPIVRINEGKAKELIDQYKELIKHMIPVKLDNGDYYPFNPKTVNMNNAFEITIPDRNISIKAYAASGKAADNIRGNRINDGLNDECVIGDTVLTTDKGFIKASKIYNNVNDYKLLSYNENTNKLEYKNIVGKNKRRYKDKLYKVKTHKQGYSIQCTKNHPLYTDKFKIKEVSKFNIGDKLISFSNKNAVHFSNIQLDILRGVMLGDGSIALHKDNKSALFKMTHSIKQIEYINHLSDIFNLKTGKEVISGYGGKTKSSWSKSSLDYKIIYEELYKPEKMLSYDYLIKLKPISLAYWFMDDGGKGNECFKLSTHSFTLLENKTIQKYFKDKYDIKVYIRIDKRCNKFFIEFSRDGSRKFNKVISKYIISSMRYKLLKNTIDNYAVSQIKKTNYKLYEILDIKIENVNKYVYNFEVEDNHNYLLSGMKLLSHNCNFESDFLNIHAALKQAARGASLKTGKRSFQYSYGTTRKGRTTAFNLWYEDQEDKINKGLLNNIQVFKWPVFDPLLYGPRDIDKCILDVPGLVPIVPWHTLEHLENERVSNYNQFIEEYLAGLVDSDDNFYPTQAIEQCEQRPKMGNGKFMSDLKSWEMPKHHGEYYMSVDPAANTDFFAIVIVERVYINGLPEYIERYLYYKQKVELPQMENKVIDLINVWKDYGLKRCIIDGNGMGFQLSETCKKVCGKKIVDIIRGNMSIKFKGRRKMPLNEFCHTRLKRFLLKKRIQLIKDDIQRIHFSGWDYDYKCDHTKEYGHGDIVDALSKCILPDNYRRVQDEEVLEIVSKEKPRNTKQEKKLHIPKVYTLLEKLEMFKKNKGDNNNIGQHYGFF